MPTSFLFFCYSTSAYFWATASYYPYSINYFTFLLYSCPPFFGWTTGSWWTGSSGSSGFYSTFLLELSWIFLVFLAEGGLSIFFFSSGFCSAGFEAFFGGYAGSYPPPPSTILTKGAESSPLLAHLKAVCKKALVS
jgi:hypothetical protein